MIVQLLLILHSGLSGQEAVSSSGGTASGTDGSVSYSVGQVVYMTYESGGQSVSLGVQQPYEVLSGFGKAPSIDTWPGISAYPNPVKSHLILNVTGQDFLGLNYEVLDISGKSVSSGSLQGPETLIDMDDLISAIYMIRVTGPGKKEKTFFIIRN